VVVEIFKTFHKFQFFYLAIKNSSLDNFAESIIKLNEIHSKLLSVPLPKQKFFKTLNI